MGLRWTCVHLDLRAVEVFKVSIMGTVTLLPQHLPWCHYWRQNAGLEILNLAPYDISDVLLLLLLLLCGFVACFQDFLAVIYFLFSVIVSGRLASWRPELSSAGWRRWISFHLNHTAFFLCQGGSFPPSQLLSNSVCDMWLILPASLILSGCS